MTSGHTSAIPSFAGLYVILDPSVRPDRPLMEVLNAAAGGGARIFQYRNKTASLKEAFAEAGPLRQQARDLKVLFLINDRCDLALALDADWVNYISLKMSQDLPLCPARLIQLKQKP